MVGDGSPEQFSAANALFGGVVVDGGEFTGGQTDADDLAWFSAAAWTATTTLLEFINVLAGFCFGNPLVDLLIGDMNAHGLERRTTGRIEQERMVLTCAVAGMGWNRAHSAVEGGRWRHGF